MSHTKPGRRWKHVIGGVTAFGVICLWLILGTTRRPVALAGSPVSATDAAFRQIRVERFVTEELTLGRADPKNLDDMLWALPPEDGIQIVSGAIRSCDDGRGPLEDNHLYRALMDLQSHWAWEGVDSGQGWVCLGRCLRITWPNPYGPGGESEVQSLTAALERAHGGHAWPEVARLYRLLQDIPTRTALLQGYFGHGSRSAPPAALSLLKREARYAKIPELRACALGVLARGPFLLDAETDQIARRGLREDNPIISGAAAQLVLVSRLNDQVPRLVELAQGAKDWSTQQPFVTALGSLDPNSLRGVTVLPMPWCNAD